MADCPIAYPDEIWKPECLYGFEGVFVSSHGRVWRKKIEFLGIGPKRTLWQRKPAVLYSPTLGRGGYQKLILRHPRGRKYGVCVHRLVCAAFHGLPPSPAHNVAHFDNDRTNNHYANLRWATQAENIADKHRHGTRQIGERHGCAKLKADQVLEIRHLVAIGADTKAGIGRKFGVNRSTVYLIAARRKWQHI